MVDQTLTLSDLIGQGIYTPQEAALYARVSTQLIGRWMWGDKMGASVVAPRFGDSEHLVSFLDFVQMLSIRAIRNQFGVPLPKIRQAVKEAESRWGISYPFAVEHTTYLFGDLEHLPHRANVVICPSAVDKSELVQVTGKGRGNKIMATIAELHMRDLAFDEHQVASAYTAWADNGRKIVLNPRKQFGDPLVADTGYSAQALWHAYKTEGGVEKAAKAYGVNAEDVELALSYLDFLQGPSSLRDAIKKPKTPV